jgi:hypothetical protein
MKVHFIPVSQNAKTRPIPVSITERASCRPGCALYENGCYAETGALAMHWDRVSRGAAGGSWPEFCGKVAALRPGRLWRYAQAGDLPGYDAAIDGTLLQELVAANVGKSVITHKPCSATILLLLRTDVGSLWRSRPGSRSISRPTTPRMPLNWRNSGSPRRDRACPCPCTLCDEDRFKWHKELWGETIAEWRDRTASLPRYTPAGRRIAVCPATYSDTTC